MMIPIASAELSCAVPESIRCVSPSLSRVDEHAATGERVQLPRGGRVTTPAVGGAPATSGAHWRDQVVEALVGLGWSGKQAADAVERVADQEPAEADLAAYLRLALRELRR